MRDPFVDHIFPTAYFASTIRFYGRAKPHGRGFVYLCERSDENDFPEKGESRMSILKRIGSIIKSQTREPERSRPVLNPLENVAVGDIIRVDLEQFVVSGKVTYFDRGFAPHRYAYYLRDGNRLQCLIVEKGRVNECLLMQFLEGALDDPNDVPTKLQVDGEVTYDLEHHRKDMTSTEGNTDFRSGDEVLLWRYFADNNRYFYLQWQDGKFVALSGIRIPEGEVQVLKSTP